MITHERHRYRFCVNKINFGMFRAQIDSGHGDSCESYQYDVNMCYLHIVIIVISLSAAHSHDLALTGVSDNTRSGQSVSARAKVFSARSSRYQTWPFCLSAWVWRDTAYWMTIRIYCWHFVMYVYRFVHIGDLQLAIFRIIDYYGCCVLDMSLWCQNEVLWHIVISMTSLSRVFIWQLW